VEVHQSHRGESNSLPSPLQRTQEKKDGWPGRIQHPNFVARLINADEGGRQTSGRPQMSRPKKRGAKIKRERRRKLIGTEKVLNQGSKGGEGEPKLPARTKGGGSRKKKNRDLTELRPIPAESTKGGGRGRASSKVWFRRGEKKGCYK